MAADRLRPLDALSLPPLPALLLLLPPLPLPWSALAEEEEEEEEEVLLLLATSGMGRRTEGQDEGRDKSGVRSGKVGLGQGRWGVYRVS